jgi:hypothetical protein
VVKSLIDHDTAGALTLTDRGRPVLRAMLGPIKAMSCAKETRTKLWMGCSRWQRILVLKPAATQKDSAGLAQALRIRPEQRIDTAFDEFDPEWNIRRSGDTGSAQP